MNILPFRLLGAFLLGALCLGNAMTARAETLPPVDFRRDISPILSDICFHCHGPDISTRKAKLRLDTKEGFLDDRDGKPAVVPGHPEKSEIVHRLFAEDPDDRMPPADYPLQLTSVQRELMRRWIAEGAKWDGHWAFQKPVQAPVPAVQAAAWPKNPVDNFILARLEKEGLKPSPEASRETLLRRVSLDLTGLPPTPAEVKAFLADKSPQAYERVVDRLLNSPRYGERMAVGWLDAARYADTHGFQVDRARVMWRWRDWVINAFNTNRSFRDFTVEQIAGDLLPNPTLDQKIATGFNRNHRINMEAGSIPEEFFTEQVIDRVDTTSTIWLGLTMGCARCHDHKYDPISQKDFYSMFAFFNNVAERGVDREGVGINNVVSTAPVLRLSTPDMEAKLTKFTAEVAEQTKEQKALSTKLKSGQEAWEKRIQKEKPTWEPVDLLEFKSTTEAKLKHLPDNSILATGPITTDQPTTDDAYLITFTTELTNVTGLRLEAIPDASLPQQKAGRDTNGNFILSRFKVFASPAGANGDEKEIEVRKATTSSDRKGFLVDDSIRALVNRVAGWSPNITNDQPQFAVYELRDAVGFAGGTKFRVELVQNNGGTGGAQLGRFRLWASTSEHPSYFTPEITRIWKVPVAKRDPRDAGTARNYYLSYQREYRRVSSLIADLGRQQKEADTAIPKIMVMQELPQPRETFVLVRGAYDKPGERVYPNVPGILPPLNTNGVAPRLAFAQWLVSPENPLTARVTVNRFWADFFGRGLVKTLENFGVQGDMPSHPELLDWLAVEFMHHDWDMKAIQKLLVMSATYRQASVVTPELLERDAENVLLARGPRFRLGAEVIRDQALAVSGLLVEKLGGPSVKPYQPPGLWEELAAGPASAGYTGYVPDTGEGLYRRSLYTYWKRTVPPPTMTTFDAPAREICTVNRSRTSTPMQALALLNDETYVEAARKLAERMLREGGLGEEKRLRYGFQLALGRAPKPSELAVLKAGLERRLNEFKDAKSDAEKLLKVGDSVPSKKLKPSELAAYTTVASVILNLDETVTKQ